MSKIVITLGRQADKEGQALRDLLSANVRKHRKRQNLSQFALATKADLSTNFIADIEAGNTWTSPQTLTKLAKALEIEAYELLKPEKPDGTRDLSDEKKRIKTLLDQFALDLIVILKDSTDKTIEHENKDMNQQ